MRHAAFTLLVSLVCNGQVTGAGPDQPYGIDIRPDAKVQERLQQVSKTFWDEQTPVPERLKAVGTLGEFERDQRPFFEQLFYFYCKEDAREGDAEAEQTFTTWLVRFFTITPMTIVETVAPYLESPEPRLRFIAGSFLGDFVRDDSYFQLYLAARRENPPPGFVEKFFGQFHETYLSSVGDALTVGSGPDRALLWAEHVINDAIWKKERRFEDAFAKSKPEVCH